MFKVFVNDGIEEAPTDDIFYIIGKEGIFLRKKLGILDSIVPVDNISILNSVDSSARLYIPKIPEKIFADMYKFFMDVYEKYASEAVLLIFFNEATQDYKIISPKQEVSAASMDYDRKFTIKNYTMIGDIHSHGSMSAFHSSVDDADEESFDGLHITLGHIMRDEISISASIVINGSRFMIDPVEYIEGIKVIDTNDFTNYEKNITTLYRTKAEEMTLMDKIEQYSKVEDKYNNRYIFTTDITNYIGVPEWIEQVKRYVPKFSFQNNQNRINSLWDDYDIGYADIDFSNLYGLASEEEEDIILTCPFCESKFYASDFKTKCPFCNQPIEKLQKQDINVSKMIAEIVLEAQKIREESYDITISNKSLYNLFIDRNDYYTKSINEAVDEAIKNLGYDKELSEPIYLLIKYSWNDIQDWSNKNI